MSLQIHGTIQLPAERRPFVNGVSSDPVELPYDATEWGEVERLLSIESVAAQFERDGTTPEGLHLTLLGMSQGDGFTLHGGTYLVDSIGAARSQPETEPGGEPFGDVELEPFLSLNAWSGAAILTLHFLKCHCVTPTADGQDIEAEAPRGITQVVLWIGKPHSNSIVQTAKRKLQKLRQAFTQAGTDPLKMAAVYAEVLNIRDDADEAKDAAKKLKKDLAHLMLSAMTRGGAETKRITTGGRTLSVNANVYAGRAVEIFEDPAAIQALKKDEGDHLLKESIAAQSWKKYLRDAVRDDDNVLPTTDEELKKRVAERLPHLSPYLSQIVRVFFELNDRRAS